MTYLRKNLIVLSVLFMMLLTVFGGSSNVNALENNSVTPRAIETYTKDYVVGCDDYGYSKIKLTIKHNMTTGKSWIVSVKHTDTIYPQYITCKINSVDTDPAVGQYFSGVISLKIDVHYQNAGKKLTATQYFRL